MILCCAFSFSSPYPLVIIPPSIICRGLSLVLFPSTLPSMIYLKRESPRTICPIHFFCLSLNVVISDLLSSTLCNTSSFVICSVQLTFSIRRHIHISQASNLLLLLPG